MKKISKIIIINLLLFILLFFIFDMICYIKNLNKHHRLEVYKTPVTFIKSYLRIYKRIFYTQKNYDILYLKEKGYNTFFHGPLNTQSPKPPILIMGCSFAFGSYLTPEESFMGQLAKLTDRPVYNRALSARAADEMLYQLSSDEFYKKVPKPEWFIYVFIPDHVRRTQIPCSLDDLGVFYNSQMSIIPNFNIPILYTIKDKINYYATDKYVLHFNRVMANIKTQAEKHWGKDIKYAFIFYDNDNIINPKIKKSMINNGFIFITLNELTPINLMTEEYKTFDKVHPSEEAWAILTPLIVEKLGL